MSSELFRDILLSSLDLSTLIDLVEGRSKELVKYHKIDPEEIKRALEKLKEYKNAFTEEVLRALEKIGEWCELTTPKEKDER